MNTKNKHVVENLMVYMQKKGVRSIIDLTYGEGNFWTDGLLKEYDVRMYDKYKHGGKVFSYERLAEDAMDPSVVADLVVLDPPYRATGGGYTIWGPDNIAKGKKVIYDMEWRNTWYIHTGTEYVCRKEQVENKINISVKPIVNSFQGFAHAFMTN